jgi:uncharacterized protein (TIRG00374 family)
MSTFSGVRTSPFILALLLNILHIFFKSVRWNRLLERQSVSYSLKDVFLVYSGSIYAGIITPGRVGELFVKALYLKTEKSIPLSKGMASIFLDRLFDMYLLIILGILGIWRFNLFGMVSNVSVVLIFMALFVPVAFFNRPLWGKFFGWAYNSVVLKKVKGKIGENFADFYDGINQLIGPELVFSGFLTCLSYFVFFMQCYLLIIAMNVSINFATITLFMAITNLISLIPVSVLGLGTRDATLIYLFSLINLQAELAVGYSFLIFFTFFIFNGLMGFFCWMAKPVSKRSLTE